MTNAYDVARAYVRSLEDSYRMGDSKIILRIFPVEEGIAVSCEPGPDPRTIADYYRPGQEVYYDERRDITGLRDVDTWSNRSDEIAEGWALISLPFGRGVFCEAYDGVTLVFVPEDGESFFP